MLTLPMPDGEFARFSVFNSPILSPPLQAQYPDIETYAGQGIDDPTATVRFDLTMYGLRAMILGAAGSVLIDPYQFGDTKTYISYWKSSLPPSKEPFVCNVTGSGRNSMYGPSALPSGNALRTYRLAVTTTGEYTQFFGSPAAAIAQVTTTVNRVTGIYEREVAVRFNLVRIQAYPNAATDPYPNGGTVDAALLAQHQTDIDGTFGSANYDIGHILTQGPGGGLAYLSVVCIGAWKARGGTGTTNPQGDAFDVDYVAHEVGHQMGGDHTFNGTSGSCGGGNRAAGSAYEPGSGTTIMAYAGICAPENVQQNSDDYFHIRSLLQITDYRESGGACGTSVNNGNTPPSVDAGPGYTIPRATAFTLTATASDPNGDAITYCWEQFDLGNASPPPNNANGPLFRSRSPSTSASRTIPQLSDILSGAATPWEILPTVDRTLTFRVTARDNRTGGGGVNADQMVVSVLGAPFAVTYPNGGESVPSVANIVWDVGGGSVAAAVNILFSADGGSSYSTLAANTPNDGSQSVAILTPTNQGRIRIEAVGNIFFDISDDNFSVPPPPTNAYVVLLDRTGSMGASVSIAGSSATNRLERAKELASADVTAVFASDPDARVAVMYFSTSSPGRTTLALDLSNDEPTVLAAISAVPGPSGATPLAEAMCVAADRLITSATPGLRNLYVYTDGDENSTVSDPASPVCGPCGAIPPDWPDLCIPTDCSPGPSATCNTYQCCLADRLIANSITNVRYFGEIITRSKTATGREDDRLVKRQAGGQPFAGPEPTASSSPVTPPDFDFLKYVAEQSNGFFSSERDEMADTVCVDTVRALNGQVVTIPITRHGGFLFVGGFNLLLAYDPSALSFLGASIGSLLDSLNWEYFTYRTGVGGNCPGGCPDGLVRLVAIADLDNGPANHPIVSAAPGALATLRFEISSNRNLIGQCAPVQFYWNDCRDNAFSSLRGDTTFLDRRIYGPLGDSIWDEDDDVQFPEASRPRGLGAPDTCLSGGGPGKPKPIRRVDFCNGWVCIDEPPDDRGDINLNGIAHEVGDAVLLTNYFIYGESVWDLVYEDAQVLASDVNDDGIVLTVADLIYLIRVITGDAEPFPPGGNPRLSPYANSATANFRVENNAVHLSTASPVAVGGALFVFRYSGMDVGTPVLSAAASGLRIKSIAANGELRVLVYPDMANTASINAGTHEIVSIPTVGEGTIELVEVQISDASGALLSTGAATVGPPKEYALLQNYPNPFNAGTVMPFMLKNTSDWTLTIYNVMGQVVRSFKGHQAAAGIVRVSWDGTADNGVSVPSGIYFYRVTTPEWSASRKMTLLK